jgi:streptomycin 6-kinase
VQNNAHARGPEGLAWLDRLPRIIATFAERWALTVETPFGDLSYNYAAPAIRADGTRAVLKLSPPFDKESIAEGEALRAFGGHGMVGLLELDLEEGAMLLERLEPGKPLHTLRDDRAEMSIAAGIMQQLWRPVPEEHPFLTLAHWGTAFLRHRAEHGGTAGPLPPAIFERGEQLYHELDASTTQRVLLHGDLHQGNILSAARQPWLAIDPKGIVGDPAFETEALLRNILANLYPVSDLALILSRRVEWLANDLGLERERVRLWGIAGMVLSAVWSAGNNGTDWKQAIELAEILDAMGSEARRKRPSRAR